MTRSARIAARQPLDQRPGVGGTHAQTVHSAVDLHEHFERPLEMRALEHPHLLGVVDDDRKPVAGNLRQLVLAEESLEQQDPALVMRRSQRDGVVALEQRKAVGIGERRHDAGEPVTVGVRLDHREHLRLRRARPHQREIRAKRGQVHLGIDRTGHGARISVPDGRAGEAGLRPADDRPCLDQSWYKARAAGGAQ
jgi:hypothetical protein